MKRILAAVLLTAIASPVLAQSDPAWTEPFEPYQVAGNVYFVGSRGLSSFLIVTPAGSILIDTGLEATVPLVRTNVEKLGFRMSDIKVLLASHAHFDHVGGHAMMQRLTGAAVMAVGEDAAALSSGVDGSALNGPGWTPVKVGRVLVDGDTVTLGGVTLTAHLTPGHTKGCTTWTMTIVGGGRNVPVVFVGGTSVNQGVTLLGNARHPRIADDYARTFVFLKSQRPDIFLAQHPSMFRMEEKVKRMKAGEKNPFVDPEGYQSFVAAQEGRFLTQLAAERAK